MKYYLAQGYSDDNSLHTLEFYWDQRDQTGCSDQWSIIANNSKHITKSAVEQYVSDQGVKGAKVISITGDGVQQGCESLF